MGHEEHNTTYHLNSYTIEWNEYVGRHGVGMADDAYTCSLLYLIEV